MSLDENNGFYKMLEKNGWGVKYKVYYKSAYGNILEKIGTYGGTNGEFWIFGGLWITANRIIKVEKIVGEGLI